MKTWTERPTELAYLFNPAFCGWVLRESFEGYASVRPAGMPLPVAFLILPIVLHRETREQVPRAVTTTLHVWLQEHPEVRVSFAERAKELAPFTREGLMFLGTRGQLRVADDGGVLVDGKLARGKAPLLRESQELGNTLAAATFVGRWFAHAGEPATLFQMWGVCP